MEICLLMTLWLFYVKVMYTWHMALIEISSKTYVSGKGYDTWAVRKKKN